MTRADDPLHDQRAEETRVMRDRDAQYALDTIRLADPEPSRPRQQRPRRPPGPQWGDDITDPLNGGGHPTEREYIDAVNQHRRRNQ